MLYELLLFKHLQLDAGGKPSTMVPAGGTRRAAAKGVYYFRRLLGITLEETALGFESNSNINKYQYF